MSLMGKTGLKKVALLSAERSQTTARKVFELDGFEPYYDGPVVREFAVRTPRPAREIIQGAIERQVLPGVDAGRWYEGLDDCLIVALTEKRSLGDIERLIEVLKE
jgi:glycine dehydrogenase subunit 1